MARIVLASWLALFLFAVPSFAADPAAEVTTGQASTARAISATAFSAALATAPAAPLEAVPTVAQNDWYKYSRRPSILPVLYVGSALLQGFDAYSTLSATKGGAAEANPLMRSAATNPIVFVGIKAAVTVTSIMAAERMWRNHNRRAAILTMAVSNGMMALVAQHNLSVLSGLQR